MNVLDRLVLRLKAINIEIKLAGNFPWIYIESVNGNAIKEEDFFCGNHGFTVAFLPVQLDKEMKITDIKKTFELIRKYK
jgi:hypothetical protein